MPQDSDLREAERKERIRKAVEKIRSDKRYESARSHLMAISALKSQGKDEKTDPEIEAHKQVLDEKDNGYADGGVVACSYCGR